jgi:hypothetical protein
VTLPEMVVKASENIDNCLGKERDVEDKIWPQQSIEVHNSMLFSNFGAI